MIYRMVPFPMTFSDLWPRFQGHGVITGLYRPFQKSKLFDVW